MRCVGWALVGVLALAAAGCSKAPEGVVPVTGTVTLNGDPLPDAFVTFQPDDENASTSRGRTDASGRYELKYSREVDGAMVGEHTVRISTYVEANPDQGTPGTPEKIPPQFNAESTLKKTVENQKNDIPIAIEHSGDVPQPSAGGAQPPVRKPRNDGC